MAGRRKPAVVRQIEGNRSRREIPREIEPEGRPRCPDYLSEAEKIYWLTVVVSLPVQLLTRADEQSLERMAIAWARFRETTDAIHQAGLLVRGSVGNVVRNPLLIVQAAAAHEMRVCGMELGLSPAARTRITARREIDDDPLAILLGPEGRRGRMKSQSLTVEELPLARLRP